MRCVSTQCARIITACKVIFVLSTVIFFLLFVAVVTFLRLQVNSTVPQYSQHCGTQYPPLQIPNKPLLHITCLKMFHFGGKKAPANVEENDDDNEEQREQMEQREV